MAVYGIIGGEKYVEIDKVLQSAQYFSVVNASINNARERKIVTLFYQGLLELL